MKGSTCNPKVSYFNIENQRRLILNKVSDLHRKRINFYNVVGLLFKLHILQNTVLIFIIFTPNYCIQLQKARPFLRSLL